MVLKKSKWGGNQKPTVSVIIPTFNEAKNLPLVLPYIPMNVVDEIIVVDGRSIDHTIDIAQELIPSIRVVKETRPGKGAAMRRGYREATGDILVVLDADGSNDPREIPRFVNALLEGADLAKGSRFAPAGGTTDMPRLRKFGNRGFVILTNILFSQSFTDLLYGFHAFWRHTLNYLEIEDVDGFEIDTSIYLQAVRKKLKVVDVPSFEGFRFYGEGKLKTFPDGWRVLRTIVREYSSAVRSPTPEPQVGFRSYGVNPSLFENNIVPITGVTTSRLINNANREEDTAMQKSYSIGELFEQRLHDLSRNEAKTLLPQILVFAIENLGASSGSLIMFDQNMQMTHGFRMFGRNFQAFKYEDVKDTLHDGIIGWVVENREPCIIPSTLEEPRWRRRSWEEKENTSRSAMIVPFVVEDQVVGVITLSRPEDRPFVQEDLSRLLAVPVKV
jgi:glycosyltransferase involved in cell wall biosynthesis